MQLPLDPTVPLGGIALILLLVWATGGRRHATIGTPAEANALLAAPETGFVAAETVVSQTGDVALARDAAGRFAAVFGSGARLAARRVPAGDIAAVTLMPSADGRAQLSIRTAAFTHPDFSLRLDTATAERWHHLLTEGHA